MFSLADSSLRRQLSLFDVTSMVVGSIIGADIYIAAALGSKLVGPSSLVVWLSAGLIAMIIALAFSYSATLYPRVGGPYAYTKEAFGEFPGFLVGWSLLLAEWLSLAVFPVAFTRYFSNFFVGLPNIAILGLKAVFILIILSTNIFSIKAAGRFNDYLTIAKLTPLMLLIFGGFFTVFLNLNGALNNLQPFFKGDIASAGQALVLIFWAYAGFELSTLPADEVQDPSKTIPRAIVVGMLIVITFYMLTNFVILSVVPETVLESSQAPLVDAGMRIFNYSAIASIVGGLVIGVGAVISIMGADESGTIGTSRLAYAMSLDGLLPKVFSVIHPKFKTPYLGLIILCGTAFIASATSTITDLINASVFLLAFAYCATCFSLIKLEPRYSSISNKLRGRIIIPISGATLSILLISQVSLQQILNSIVLLIVGIPLYIYFTPKKELEEVETYLSRNAVLNRAYEQNERFLAHFILHIKEWIARLQRE